MSTKPLSVLYVSSEVYPFAKTGGLADVSYSLSLAIRDLGHDIRVMLPKYGNISERKNRIHEINRLRDIMIPVGDIYEPATVKSSSINNPRTKVQAYVTTNFNFFDAKKGLYSDPTTGKNYNNDERFIFFDRTVIQTCLLLGWFPDIIHCNGWQTGLVPALVRTVYAEEFAKTKVVFSIHNFSEQGFFPLDSLEKTGIPEDAYPNMTHDKKMNFTKAGIAYADRVTTVSPTYAQEILKDKTIGGGLHTSLKGFDVHGILNGIDLYGWMPKSDPFIAKQYDAATWQSGKPANKKKLLEKFGLTEKAGTPVIGVVSRLSESKGTPLLIEALPQILAENVQVVLLGDGDIKMKKDIEKIAAKFKKNFSVNLGFDDELAHLIEAGTDMFLMPSLHEPCGLNQMYSMMYGSVPIARATGGLADTVTEFDAKKSPDGTGFVFKKYEAAEFLAAVKRALKVYGDTEMWGEVVKNGMSRDFSWAKSARHYEEVYRSLMM
ncbi:MAG: glycogen synthase [Candidatus Kapabacteria bacterium]|nr:glycogen synthase [Candidatus Kapabacteria bacterium]